MSLASNLFLKCPRHCETVVFLVHVGSEVKWNREEHEWKLQLYVRLGMRMKPSVASP